MSRGNGWSNGVNMSTNAQMAIEELRIPQIFNNDDKEYYGEMIEYVIENLKNSNQLSCDEDYEVILEDNNIDSNEKNVAKLKELYNLSGVELIDLVKNEEVQSWTEWHHLNPSDEMEEIYFFDVKSLVF